MEQTVILGQKSPEEQEHRKNAVTAMVLSIVGLGLSFIGGLNIAGLILSILGLTRSRNNRLYAQEKGIAENNMNEAGYVCGVIGVIVSSITILATILILGLVVTFAGSIFNLVVLPAIM